jgi:photosystem II stability/assembly factor-like uncharacterized protein
MSRPHFAFVAGLIVLGVTAGAGQSSGPAMSADALKGLEFRSIGPTLSTGRVADIAADPNRPDVYYVASAVGGLWKSENRGNTWHSVFDNGGSFNMCCVVVDPKNSDNVWLGTGENSNPRSATYGDGLYKSTDGGEHFTRVGLETSEHIGAIKIDPRNSDVVWVAAQGPLWSTGGDRGIFKTTDGGKTWRAAYTVSADTGANDLVIDPNNPEVVYASMWQRRRGVGQMIGGGPEGGIVKSIDGGKTWTKLSKGLPPGDVGRIALGVDPKAKPTRVYALLNGLAGDSGFFRSDDAGANWMRMGAPYGKPGTPDAAAPDQAQCDQPAGRRGGNAPAATPPAAAAAAPARGGAQAAPPAGAAGAGAAGAAGAPQGAARGGAGGAGGGGGGGGRGGCAPGAYCGGDPGYYQEIFVDPVRSDTIWSANTNLEWSRDGGKCWSGVPNMNGVHVDFHSVWMDTKDKNHIMVGNDGGAYESWDEGKTWRHFDNLPVTQFYRVAVDDALPFYNVCGGAQDNESQCGPSRTMNRVGIRMSDWWMTGGCDGFQSRMEPGNPNIVYSACQSGGVSRMDLRTGENKSVRPGGANVMAGPYDPPPAAAGGAGAANAAGAGRGGRAGGGGAGGGGGRGGGGERTNWDAPYIISPHSPTRLYFGSSRLYRSDDRGDHWMAISPELTKNLDARVIPIMGKVWDPTTTVAYNNATTPLSTIVSLDESPLAEGLIYVGTDDGLLQVTEDAGKTWRKTDHFEGVPDGVWLTDVLASPRDANVVFVTLNNWQRGDFKPYIVRSDDRGKTFKNITGDLPTSRTDVYSIAQDHVNGNLLFAGAEFGLFVTVDGGSHWTQLKGGLPTTQIRDIAVQRRESDLVLGTFGRSIYILDDYSALREMTPESLAREAELYPLRHVYAYNELAYVQSAWGNTTTPNPPAGATFTYSVGSGFSGQLAVNIADDAGKLVCRMEVPATTGVDRATWNLRAEPPNAGGGGGRGGGGGAGGGGGRGRGNANRPCIDPAMAPPTGGGAGFGGGGGGRGGGGPMVPAGHYVASIGKVDGDKFTPIGKPQPFQVVPLPVKNW